MYLVGSYVRAYVDTFRTNDKIPSPHKTHLFIRMYVPPTKLFVCSYVRPPLQIRWMSWMSWMSNSYRIE